MLERAGLGGKIVDNVDAAAKRDARVDDSQLAMRTREAETAEYPQPSGIVNTMFDARRRPLLEQG